MILLTDEELDAIDEDGSNYTAKDVFRAIAKAQLKKVAGQMEDTYDKAPIGKKFAAMDRFMLDLLREVE